MTRNYWLILAAIIVFPTVALSLPNPILTITVQKDKIRVKGGTAVLVTVTGLTEEYFQNESFVEVSLRITNPLAAAWAGARAQTKASGTRKLTITSNDVGPDGAFARSLNVIGIQPGPYQVTGSLSFHNTETIQEDEIEELDNTAIPNGHYRVAEIAGPEGELPDAEIQTSGGAWAPLNVGSSVKAGDALAAGYGTSVLLVDNQGGRILMHPLSTVTLPTDQTEIQSEVKLEFGKIEIELRESGLKTDLKIKMPGGSFGIRGTHVMAAHDKDTMGSMILLRKGSIAISSGEDYLLLDAAFNPGKVSRVLLMNGEIGPVDVIDLRPVDWILN